MDAVKINVKLSDFGKFSEMGITINSNVALMHNCINIELMKSINH